MSDSMPDLETLLREKEELIDALTERLELTAEQLDRLQRANGDRGHWLAGGVPAELVEQQQTLCEDLERVVLQWEETQPGAALGRIEMQLVELRDLVSQLSGGGVTYGGASRPRDVAAEEPEHAESSAASGWEALKAGLLAQNPAESDSGQPSASEMPVVPDGPDPFDSEPLNAPESIDLDSADVEELRYAVLARDEFIAELLRRLRSVESRTRPTDGWKALESTPEDLREQLESLERRLEQTLRMSEVELSIERAKLGREAARIKQMEENAQKTMDRLGVAMAAQESDDESDDEPQQDNSPDGRWRRMLGMKRQK